MIWLDGQVIEFRASKARSRRDSELHVGGLLPTGRVPMVRTPAVDDATATPDRLARVILHGGTGDVRRVGGDRHHVVSQRSDRARFEKVPEESHERSG